MAASVGLPAIHPCMRAVARLSLDYRAVDWLAVAAGVSHQILPASHQLGLVLVEQQYHPHLQTS